MFSNKKTRSLQQELKKRTEEKEQEEAFLSMVLHELRSPVTGIKWGLEALQKDVTKFTVEERKILHKSLNATKRVMRLLEELAHARAQQAWHFQYEFAPINLGNVVGEILDEFKEQAHESGITLTRDIPSGVMPRVMLDQDKYTLALQNIIENALHYTKPGGVIAVVLEYTKKEAVLTIKDSGIGIPANDQPYIFTRFFRGGNAKKHRPKGTGLGLSVAKTIIEKHSGTITFTSRENEGTTFTITLPLQI